MEIVFGYAVALIFGFVIGVTVFYFMSSGSPEDTKALKALQEEHTNYQQQVDSHFVETAELFKDLTDRYRALYTHMANSADGLCSEEVKQLKTDLGNPYLLADAPDNVESVAQVEAPAHEFTEDDLPKPLPKENAEAAAREAESAKESAASEAEGAKRGDGESDVPLASEVEVPPELRSSKG